MTRRSLTPEMEIMAAMERALKLWSSGKTNFVFELKDWSLSRDTESTHPSKEVDAATIHRMSSDFQQAEFLVQLSKALMTSASELLDLHIRRFNPIRVKLSKGLSSLPDELLAHIFKFVDHDEEDNFQHSLHLSHVSRKFRGIVLGYQTFWSSLCLRENTKIDNVKRSITRSGDTDLHMIIKRNESVKSVALTDFMSACASTLPRWRSLNVLADGCWIGLDHSSICDIFLDFMHEHHLELPHLDVLRLTENRLPQPSLLGDEHIALWIPSAKDVLDIYPRAAPKLRALHCIQCIPSPSFPLTFTSLMLSMRLQSNTYCRQVGDLIALLKAKPTISELVLELKDAQHPRWGVGNADEFKVAAVSCPAVTSFRADLSLLYPEDAAIVIAPTMAALRMPQLQRFFLSLEMEPVGLYGEWPTSLHPVADALLPDPLGRPLLTSVTISVRFRQQNAYLKTMSIDVPLDKIPHASSLSITAPCRISFSHRVAKDGEAPFSSRSSLRELELYSCKNLNVDGLRYSVQHLKEVGAWEALERVTIRDCDLLPYDAALEIVGKERLCMAHF